MTKITNTQNRIPFYVLILFLLAMSTSFSAQEPGQSPFIDPNDGMMDMSKWLKTDHGFLPVPMVITEPAVGYGGGLSLVFFHETEDRPKPKGQFLTPSMTGLGGLYTENDTWAGGIFHFGSWKQDSIRYLGAVARTSINLTYYGPQNKPLFNGVDYNLDGLFTMHELMFRLPDTRLFLGGHFSYFGSKSTFDTDLNIPGIDKWELDFNNFGLGPMFKYDTLDNMFTPNKGLRIDGQWIFYADGDDMAGRNYQIIKTNARSYFPIADNMVLGWRLDGRFSTGNVPFYSLPFIDIRGIPAMRYQDKNAGTTELELRYNLTDRWALVGFGGIGKTATSLDDFFEGNSHGAGGMGLRYLIAKEYGIYSGLDVACGPEDWVVYLQVGSAWR